ncbi:MAG TPA: type II CAAX endopeptidase family protein [Thermoanaerobaculia bacterium]|nr:type II CAAX endopeptidase family protein [Thermoanaerobaculia bacterium]
MFTRRDVWFLAVCGLLFAGSLAVVLVWFEEAFPEASIEFRYDRDGSRPIAEELLERLAIGTGDARAASRFAWDDEAKIYLERSVDAEDRARLLRQEVELWFWRHRWFRPLEVEEARVDVSPSGEIVGLEHVIEEEAERAALDPGEGEGRARAFLESLELGEGEIELVATATRELPNRVDTTLTFESASVRPAGAPYRYRVTFHGDRIGGFRQFLEVPEAWSRSYSELRSKNHAAGAVDTVFLLITIVAALVVFIARLRRGDVAIRFTVAMGAAGAVLVVLVALNAYPSALAAYDTGVSWNAFVAQQAVFSVLQGLVLGVFLIVLVGAGETLYRERLPRQLALPRLLSREALRSRRLFMGLVLGYTLVPAFMAYQTIFYLVAARYGAWSPAEIPYAEILNSALPWAAVLFMGFFPAVSEEFLSRAFSIPLFERWFRSTWIAIVAAGFIWGFGHAAYPNQPFWIRGVEVGLAGVVIGLLMLRWGLVPLLIWHYTVDAVYTALLLFRSGNAYYIASAAISSFLFLVPLIASVVLLIRHRGFAPDEHLTNEAAGSAPAPAQPRPAEARIEGSAPVRRWKLLLISLPAIAAVAWWIRPPLPRDAVEYRVTAAEAKRSAAGHLAARGIPAPHQRTSAVASAGFRGWNERSARDEGGSPGGYALIAAERILETGGVDRLLSIQSETVKAGTWVVRLFAPMQKEETLVEIDGRSGEAVGWHRSLDESAAGARPEREEALAPALAELRRAGLDARGLELKEAVPFEQPERRDWLFHFDSREELAPEVRLRASVRVAGGEVTQFATTARVAERVIRAETQQTLLNTILTVLQICGVIGLLTLLAHGFIAAVRHDGVRWRAPARLALAVSPLAVGTVLTRIPEIVASYDTAIAWNTFLVMAATSLIVLTIAQLGLAFVSGMMIETTTPGALALVRADGRGRFGRDAAVSGLVAAGAIALAVLVTELLVRWAPAAFPVSPLPIPTWIDRPIPLLSLLWSSLLYALAFAAAAAAIRSSARAVPRPRLVVAAAALALGLATLDTSAGGIEIATSSALVLLGGFALVWGSRLLFGANPLAWFAGPLLALLLIAIPTVFGVTGGRALATAAAAGLAAAAVLLVLVARSQHS